MSGFIAFSKKEFTESWRTYKFMVMTAVYLVLGMMNPLLAKLTPEILKSVAGELNIALPEPTALDAWAQFFKNVGQMGIIAMVIVFAGLMGNELGKGTLINLLTKGMKRRTVILSKFSAASVLWLFYYGVCAAATYGYTIVLWGESGLTHGFFVVSALWLFGELVIALLILGGTLFGGFVGALLTCGGVIVALNIAAIIPAFSKISPTQLSGGVYSILTGANETGDFTAPYIITVAATIVIIFLSIKIFENKKI